MSSKFSVLMSVYNKENPVFLRRAMESIYEEQYLKPDEIILVKDGPLTPILEECIAEFQTKLPSVLKVYSIEENVGLGSALNVGLEKCSYELVARMDTDDIALPNRFEVQLKYMDQNSDIDVCGCALEEFNKEPGDLKYVRFSKKDHQDLIWYAKFRNPLNHITTIFKKSKVLAVGSYMDMPGHEDYYLWVRMILNGARLGNITQTLLYCRVGNGMVGRRSGIKYMQHEYRFLKAIRQLRYINGFTFWVLFGSKLTIRLMPKPLLAFVYRFLRKKVD